MRHRIAAVSLAVALAGCAAPVTEIVVEVRSDLRVPRDIDEIAVEVDASAIGQPSDRRSVALVGGPRATPIRITLVHRGGTSGPLRVTAIALRDGDEQIRQVATASFRPGQTVWLHMDLDDACRGVVECHDDETCVDGSCVELVGADGGPSTDAGPADAGPCAPFACEAMCVDACRCEPGYACRFSCPDDAECTDVRCDGDCTFDGRGATRIGLECRGDARCQVDARGANVVDAVRCRQGSSCDVDCTGATDCKVRCEDESSCLLRCGDTSSCEIQGCGRLDDGDLRACGENVFVCRLACP